MNTKGLGKGLGALLGDMAVNQPEGGALNIKLSQIEPNLSQPRKDFDSESLSDLAESISQNGIISPLAVRRLKSGRYQIIAGERRWRAARMAGLSEVPAVVFEADDRKAMELALIENLQRENLNPIEEAEGYRALIEQYGLTQEKVAAQVGRSRPAVANALRLLALPGEISRMLRGGEISGGHARALLQLGSEADMLSAAGKISLSGASVRETEALVKSILSAAKAASDKAAACAAIIPDYLSDVEKDLSSKYGRKIKITRGKKHGRLEMEFYGDKDLQALIDALNNVRGV